MDVIVDASDRIKMAAFAVDDTADVCVELLPEFHLEQRPPKLSAEDDVILQEGVC